MQMILNDAEAKEYLRLKKEYLRLKAIYDADANLGMFEKRLKYFYNTYLVPIHERVDLDRYPDTPKATEEDLEKRLRRSTEALLDIVSDIRKELKANQNNDED